jgi:hypothetical protein
MHLGVPFIAPRQLGAVEDQQGRLSLPSVEWRTGQSDAPPDSHCRRSGADLLPLLTQTIVVALGWLAPDSPVPPADRWSRPRVVRGLRDRPLAHRTVR